MGIGNWTPVSDYAETPFLVLEPNPAHSRRYAYETAALSASANFLPITMAAQNPSFVPVALLCTIANLAFQGTFWHQRKIALKQRHELYMDNDFLLVMDFEHDKEQPTINAFRARYARINIEDIPSTLVDAGGPCLRIHDGQREIDIGKTLIRPELERAVRIVRETLSAHTHIVHPALTS